MITETLPTEKPKTLSLNEAILVLTEYESTMRKEKWEEPEVGESGNNVVIGFTLTFVLLFLLPTSNLPTYMTEYTVLAH